MADLDPTVSPVIPTDGGTPAQSIPDAKMQAVAEASAAKIADMSGLPSALDFRNAAITRATGSGMDTSTGVGRDLASLTYDGIREKYGDQGDNMVRGLTSALQTYQNQTTGYRDEENVASDAVSGVGLSVANLAGGIANFGAGLVSPKAAMWGAKQLQDLGNYVHGTQSVDLQNRRQAEAERAALAQRDERAQYDKDVGTDGSFVAGLKQVGRGFLDSASHLLASPELASDATFEGLGSLVLGGPMTKSTAWAMNGIKTGAATLAPEWAGSKAAALLGRVVTPGAVTLGVQEGTGAANDAVTSVADMPQEELDKSPYYQGLIQQGMSPDDARIQTAHAQSLAAFGPAAIGGVAMSKLTGLDKIIHDPLHVPSLRTGLGNLARETAFEGGQSGTSTLSGNTAAQHYSEPDKALSDNVGQQMAQGAVAGFGGGVVTAGPQTAGHAALSLVQKTGKTALAGLAMAGNATAKSVDDLKAKNDAASPISDTVMRSAADEAATQAPEAETAMKEGIDNTDATDEQKSAGHEYVDRLLTANQFDDSHLDVPGMSPAVKDSLTGSKDQLEAMQRLAGLITDPDQKPRDALSAALVLHQMKNRFEDVAMSDPDVVASLDPESPALKLIKQYGDLAANIYNTPAITKGLSQAQGIIDRVNAANNADNADETKDTKPAEQAEPVIPPITAESLKTADGQQDLHNAIGVATVEPAKASLETNNMILAHAEAGRIHLTQEQHQALLASNALLQAAKTASDQQNQLGHTKRLDAVSDQIQVNSDPNAPRLSAAAHATGIFQAVRAGNMGLAKDRLAEFGKFATHMGHKVDALNQHYEQGGGPNVPYQALDPESRKWYQDKKGLAVHPDQKGSVEFAQRTALEAQRLAGIHNGLAKAFPALEAKEIQAPELHKDLQGKPEEVAQAFQKGDRIRPVRSKPGAVVSKPVTPAANVVEGKSRFTPAGLKAVSKLGLDTYRSVLEARKNPTADDLATLEDLKGEQARRKEEAKAAATTGAASPTARSGKSDTETAAKGEISPELLARVKAIHAEADALDAKMTKLGGISKLSPEEQKLVHMHMDLNNEIDNQKAENRLIEAVKYAKSIGRSNIGRTMADLMDYYSTVRDQAMIDSGDEVSKNDALRNRENLKNLAKQLREVVGAVTEESSQSAEEAPKPQGMEAAYPNLVGSEPGSKITNFFIKAFRLAKDMKSRIMGNESPLAALKEAASSREDLARFIGGKEGHAISGRLTPDIARAYRAYLKKGDVLGRIMDQRLQTALGKVSQKDATSGTLLQRFLGGKVEANRLKDGKQFNITEPDGKGGLRYNRELKEGAILAGLQWLLNANHYGSAMDAKGISRLTGIPEDQVDSDLVNAFNQGMPAVTAKRTLADKITQFWGLQANKDVPAGYAKGIAESMAAEVLEALEQNGDLVKSADIHLTEADGLPQKFEKGARVPNVKDINLYASSREKDPEKEDPLNQFPSLIERTVAVEPEDIHYFGEDRPKVSPTQLHNPLVQNRPEQKTMIRREQETPHFINQPMVNLYNALSLDNILRLFGAGNLEGRVLNENHAKSLDGKNQTIIGAFQYLNSFLDEAGNAADTAGPDGSRIDLDKLPVRFAYNVNRVGRLQMLGRFNEQSNKLVREAVSPTWSTLDLSTETGKDYQKFALGLAQALGIKVHKMSLDTAIQKVEDLLNGHLAPSVEALQAFHQTGKAPAELTDTLLDNFARMNSGKGEKLTTVALHALEEYARYQEAEDPSKFRTSLYVEADGVTNGPACAMALLSAGKFTKNWVNRMAKTGLFFRGPKTMNEQQSYDSNDMYQTTTNNLLESMKDMENSISDGRVKDQLAHLKNLMNLFMPDFNLKEDENGNTVMEMNRGIAKNPLTITLYRSGEKGIAAKITRAMTDALYERMSEVAEKMDANPKLSIADAMFNGDEKSQKQFIEAYQALTSNVVGKNRKGELFFKEGEPVRKPTEFNPRTWTLDANRTKNLQENVRHMFVSPLRNAITETVGKPLMDSIAMLQAATQVQSLFQQHAFSTAVQALIDEKSKTNPRARMEGLSQNELGDILKDVIRQFPMIHTGQQDFFIAGSQSTDVNDTEYSNSLSGGFRTDGFVHGPRDSGVSGVPTLVVGMGDGMIMQYLAAMKGAPVGSLKIFDGVNFPLDKLEDSSRKANRAVSEAWKGNPLQAVHEAYAASLPNFDISKMTNAEVAAVARSVMEDSKDERAILTVKIPADATPEFVEDIETQQAQARKTVEIALKGVAKQLRNAAISVEARQRAMDMVAHNIDQMAAAGEPYQHDGIELKGTDDGEIANELNALYVTELAKVQKEYGVTPAPEAAPVEVSGKDAPTVGALDSTGVRVLNSASWSTLVKSMKLSPQLQKVFNQLQLDKSAADYKVVYGKREQLIAYAKENNQDSSELSEQLSDSNTRGVTNTGSKTIYLIKPSKETLLHELIHAATFEKVQAVIDNRNHDPAMDVAVMKLRILMDQFQKLEPEFISPVSAADYANTLSAISRFQREGNLAAALNEFMAWGLANKNMSADMANVKAHPLVQLAKDVVQAIGKLIFGSDRVPAVADDMLSHLLFHTSIIARTQPTVQAVSRDVNLCMNARYGDNQRLADLNETFDNQIVNYLDANPTDTGDQIDRAGKVMTALVHAGEVTMLLIAHGFPGMTYQEETTLYSLVAALATEAEIHPGSLTEAERLYAHVAKTLTVEDFMKDPDGDPTKADPNDRYQAQQKYDSVMGNFLTSKDEQLRSSLLPVFLGLAITNDGFREVLSRMGMPKGEKSDGTTLDGKLENVGLGVMNTLSRRIAGTDRSDTVKQGVDALSRRIREISQNRQTIMDQFTSPVGSLLDRANQVVSQGLDALADAAMKATARLDAKYNNRLTKLLNQSTRAAAMVGSEKNADKVAHGVMSAVNRFDGWTPIKELIGDLVGRTGSNAGVFDLIKTIRSDVARDRQQFREAVPKIMASKFSRKLTDDEWTSLYKGLAKTDLAALDQQLGREDVLKLLHDGAHRQEVIDALKEQLQTRDPAHWPLLEEKMNQLANFMNTGRAGRNLLRNADAVANLLGEKTQKNRATPNKAFVSAVDKLTSLYALEKLAQNHKDTLASLAKDEHEGVHFALSYLVGQRKDEMDKTDAPRARFNYYKGHIASLNQNGRSLIVANDNRYNELLQRGYKRVGDYVGSAAEGSAQNRGYYYAPVSARASFNQGLMQNVRHTAYGVEALSGFTDGITAGRIADPESVNHISKVLAREGKSTLENLLPVYDADGRIAAYERSVDPDQLLKMNPDTHLGRMTGVWRGRQVEEAKAQVFNQIVIDTLHAMYKKDMQESSGNKTQYVDMLDAKALARDPTLQDAASLLSQEAIDYAHSKYGADALYVRRDMLNDAVGVRKATIGDAWTGNTRWSPEIQLQVRNLATAAMGNNAYRFLVGTEQEIQSVVRDAKSLIVVKSIIVPWANFVGNIYSLLNRGIPITHIVRSMPNKMAEVHTYTQGRLKEIQLGADLRAASGDVVRERILGAEIQSLQDSYRRMSIWPLLEAGELSAISTHGIDRGDIELTGGRLAAFIKAAIEKLPSSLQTAGRYALITKETALYQALAKSVEWGDFMAKAIMYDDLTKRKNLSRADAMGKVTEEFVNYDRMPGRFREYMESMGMLWFYNFKIRATKVAVSTIRNNPVHALLTTLVPALPFFPSAGTPLTDNLFTKGAKGVLSYSTGPRMMLHAPMLNPWVEIAHWAYKAF